MPHHRCPALIALVALIAVAAGEAGAERLPRVAIVVLLEVNVAPERVDALTGELGDAVRQRLAADVIAGREVRRRIPAAAVSAACAAEPACLRDLGERLEADTLLLVVAAGVGDQVQLEVTWANPRTGETLAREAILVPADGAAETFAAAAPRLLPELPPRPTRAGDPAPSIDLPESRPGRHLTLGSSVSGGISVAALAGGIGLALAARAEHADLEVDPCAVTRTCDVGTLRRYTVGADALLGTALVAGAVALWLYAGSADDELGITAGLSGTGASLVFGGRF